MDRRTDSETGKEEKIDERLGRHYKAYMEMEDKSTATFEKLYAMYEHTPDGRTILRQTPEMILTFNDFITSRMDLHMKGIEIADDLFTLTKQNRKKLDDTEYAMAQMILANEGEMHKNLLASMLALLTLSKTVFTEQLSTSEKPSEDDILTKLKKAKEELASLKQEKGEETASVNILMWENWKKRGIL